MANANKKIITSETEQYREPQRVINMRARGAATYLGVGLSTIWLYAKQKKITAIKLSDRVTIFKKDDLDRFINANVEVA